MCKRILLSMVCFWLGATIFDSSPESTISLEQTQNIQRRTLFYCALMHQPDLYKDSESIRLSAIWHYGFEWSFLSSPDCPDQPKIWIEFADTSQLCSRPKANTIRLDRKKFDNQAEVTVVGKLYSGPYGHMGGYQFKFVVTCLESVRKLSRTAQLKH